MSNDVIVHEDSGCVLCGAFWMVLLSLLLCWLPGVGTLIAGIVGGKIAGGVGNALAAALLPCLLVGGLVFVSGTLLTGVLLFGAVLGALTLAIVFSSTLLLGALIGGLIA